MFFLDCSVLLMNIAGWVHIFYNAKMTNCTQENLTYFGRYCVPEYTKGTTINGLGAEKIEKKNSKGLLQEKKISKAILQEKNF